MAFDRHNRRFMALLKRPNPRTVGRSCDVSFSHDFVEWTEPRFLFGMDRERDQEMALDIIRRRLTNAALARPLFVDPDPATRWVHPDGAGPRGGSSPRKVPPRPALPPCGRPC